MSTIGHHCPGAVGRRKTNHWLMSHARRNNSPTRASDHYFAHCIPIPSHSLHPVIPTKCPGARYLAKQRRARRPGAPQQESLAVIACTIRTRPAGVLTWSVIQRETSQYCMSGAYARGHSLPCFLPGLLNLSAPGLFYRHIRSIGIPITKDVTAIKSSPTYKRGVAN
jgi:hypothetical protein